MTENTKFFSVFVGVGLLLLIGVYVVLNRQNAISNVPTSPTPFRTSTVTSTPSSTTTTTMIEVNTPLSNAIVSSPVSVSGQARGNWYFEASFPVRVVDANGTVLATVPVQAEGDWMTTNFVPFFASVPFTTPTAQTGFIIFEKDNPSGLAQNAAEYRVPVQFRTFSNKTTSTVKIFFGSTTLLPSGQDECTSVFSVNREIPSTLAVGRAALEELLKGPTDLEKTAGYYTSLNSGIKIQKLTIENGIATVDFDKKLDEAIGGSCRVTHIRKQIIETLKQFSTVKNVVISIDGRTEDILQP